MSTPTPSATGRSRSAPSDPTVLAHVAAWLRLGAGRDQLPAMSSAPDLSRGVTVAICTYKRSTSLRRLLDSLIAQESLPDRVIIVDASPDDETEHMVRSHRALTAIGCDVLYFRVAGPLRGLTKQRNFALRWVATDLVAFFDDDVALYPGCCAELERQHRELGARVVGVGALIENQLAPPRLVWRLRTWLGIVSSLRPGSYCRSGMSIPWSFLSPMEQGVVEGEWLPGGATMWRTAAAREVRFNETFVGNGIGEDLDFSLRVSTRGALAVAGRARVVHHHDARGRPDAYESGYRSLSNWYDIHRRCLSDRTWADGAYFVYAFSVDTLLEVLAFVKGHSLRVRWRSLRGRLRFFSELCLGRHAMERRA